MPRPIQRGGVLLLPLVGPSPVLLVALRTSTVGAVSHEHIDLADLPSLRVTDGSDDIERLADPATDLPLSRCTHGPAAMSDEGGIVKCPTCGRAGPGLITMASIFRTLPFTWRGTENEELGERAEYLIMDKEGGGKHIANYYERWLIEALEVADTIADESQLGRTP